MLFLLKREWSALTRCCTEFVCTSLLQCTAGPSETIILWIRLNSSVESLYCTFLCLLRPADMWWAASSWSIFFPSQREEYQASWLIWHLWRLLHVQELMLYGYKVWHGIPGVWISASSFLPAGGTAMHIRHVKLKQDGLFNTNTAYRWVRRRTTESILRARSN